MTEAPENVSGPSGGAAAAAAPVAGGQGIEAPRPVDAAMVAWMLALTGLWGLNAISIKVLVGGMAPVTGAALRGVAALALLTPYGWWKGESLGYFSRDGLHGAVAGVLFAGEFTLVYTGARFTNGGHVALLFSTSPIFVAIEAHFLLVGDRLTRLRVAGLVLAFAGIAALFSNELFVTGSGYWRGDLLVLGGAFLWGSTTVYLKRTIAHRMSAFRLLYVQILASTPLMLLAGWVLEPAPFRAATTLTWAMVAYQAVVVVFFSYMVWMAMVKRYPASSIQSFTLLTPVWGVVMGAVLLGEAVPPLTVAGIALVGLGLYLVNRPRRPRRA